MKKVFLYLTGFLGFIILPISKVVAAGPADPKWTDITFPTTGFSGGIENFIAAIITWMLNIIGVFAVFALIYSGILYVTSAGDPTKTETAKKNLTWAIIGIAVVLLCRVILYSIVKILEGNA